MKLSFSFIVALLLCISVESIIKVDGADCWEHTDPLKPWKKTLSSTCGLQPKSKSNLQTGTSGKSNLAAADAFKIVFTCTLQDQVKCGKAKNAFVSAGQIIANLIQFKSQVVVNATFANFCETLGECGGKILGAAGAARTIPLLDEDNVVRQYPQALVKQFPLSPQPKFTEFDIQAFFNAEADLFFDGDAAILPNQFDFQYIILHELIHGLGFASGWNNYFSDQPVALTPDPSFLDDLTSLDDPVTFTGFVETAFDRYMLNFKAPGQQPKKMSDFAAEMNKFAKIGTKFSSVMDLLNTFEKSPQFRLSNNLIIQSQIPKNFAIRPRDAKSDTDLANLVFLETNIPFQQGSSISHVDSISFRNTSDFLQVFNARIGKSLDQILTATGGTYPIGPRLQSVLETLGYTTANNTNPYVPKLPNNLGNSPSTNSNGQSNNGSSATSLTSSFNILSIFVIASIILLI